MASPSGSASRTKDDPAQWEKFFHEVSQKLARDEADARPPRFRDAEIIYAIDRGASLAGQSVALDLMSRQRTNQRQVGPAEAGRRRDARRGRTCRIRSIARSSRCCSARATSTAPATSATRAARRSGSPGRCVDRVLPLIAQSGRAVLRIRRQPTDELMPLTWDDGPPWVFRLEVGHVVARRERVDRRRARPRHPSGC